MNTVLIPLRDNQIKLLLDCIDSEQIHAQTDELNEELNDVRRTLLNESGYSSKEHVQQWIENDGSSGPLAYQSRFKATPEHEESAQSIVEQHTPMPPNYPQ